MKIQTSKLILFTVLLVAVCYSNANQCTKPCGEYGTCQVLSSGTEWCDCWTGYEGGHCEHLEDLCAAQDCSGNGQCNIATIPELEMADTYCDCNAGYTGRECETVEQSNTVDTPDTAIPDQKMETLDVQQDVGDTTATDCTAYAGQASDVYPINIDGTSIDVYCEINGDEIWTVIQRRVDDSVRFDRTFVQYEDAFGDPEGNFWIGLKAMNKLTETPATLRVDLQKFDGSSLNVVYNSFSVGAAPDYAISVSGPSPRNRDSIDTPRDTNNNMPFTTQDRPGSGRNCAAEIGGGGGWWYNPIGCSVSYLNGRYHNAGSHWVILNGIQWASFTAKESLKFASMKIKH